MLASLVLLALVPFAVSSPAPVDPGVAAVIGSNLNLGCQHGCDGTQQLDTSAALGSVVSPLSVLGSLALAGGVLAAV